FAQNEMSQHMVGQNVRVVYKAYIDKKTASSTVNQYDESTLRHLIKSTEDLARINQPDPEYTESIGALEYPKVKNVMPETEALTPEKIVDIIREAVEFAREKDTKLSGIFSLNKASVFYFTKNGFEGNYDTSSYEFSMTMKRDERETKVSTAGKDFAKFSLKAQLDQLYSQFSALDKPNKMEPETINVILRPQAVANLMMYLRWGLDRRMADEGLTPLKGQIGKQYFGEKFNMSTVSEDDSMTIIPFFNDTVVKDIDWIKDGVVKALPTNKTYANMIGTEATSMFNVYISGGDTSEEEMMKMVDRGLIINNFWYIRPNDMRTADFTGMTRDGVLYFENGEVKHSVNNFRFNEKLHEITRRILALGESAIVFNTSKVPTMLIKDFHFIDRTNF
ncbi:MAG: metallopeptidase TldD-related protein, partial [Candidatus Cloacimonetes bacterium]|nr:metallopeptidase TldD-related protein [Candidatus Cloacimonadota bacterium]